MPEEIVILALAGMGLPLGIGILLTINKHLERKHQGLSGGDGLRAEIDELRARVDEIEGVRERCADLEERVDFTERMLARERGADEGRLGAGNP